MKRWTMALAALVTGALSLAHADYVKIMINVGGSPERKTGGQPGAGGEAVTPPGGGETVTPPGGIRIGGPGGGRLQGIGVPGGAGLQGGSPDDPGRGTPGGSGGDVPGANLLRPPGGGDTSGGGSGRGLTLGNLGTNLGGLVGSGEATPGGEAIDSRAIWIEAIVEYDAKDARTALQGSLYVIKHPFGGQTYLPVPMPNNPAVRVIREGPITAFVTDQYRLIHIKGPTLAQRYEQKRKEMAKLKQENDVTAQVNLAQWALQHGLVDEVPKIMEKAAKADPKHPAVVAFQATEAAVRRDAKPGDEAEVWRERLSFRLLDGRHYRIVYDEKEALARRLLGRLEKNYRSFFYWWALRGTPLPVPEPKLVAILVEEERAFDYQHKNIFDEAPMVGDGFLARRDNVAIFSGKRLDPAFEALTKFSRPHMEGLSQEQLLAGKGWRKDKSPHDVATAQMLRLMQEALQDEAEFMTATHEGTRQLVAAVGLLPRTISAPQWIDYGMGSFFETHKGAFWASTAGPSWVHLNTFKGLEKDKRFEKVDVNLKNVVTDRLFHEAKDLALKEKEDRQKERERAKTAAPAAGQPEPPAATPRESEKDRDTAERALARARATSWGMTYFLAHQRMSQLLRYYQELQQLPRDLPFDEDVLWVTFARAFDLMDSARPDQVDGAKVFKLASEWQRYLKSTPLPAAELRREVVKEDSKSP